MKNLFTYKIPLFYLLFLMIIAIGCTFLITYSYYHLQNSFKSESLAMESANVVTCDYNTRRLGGYNYVSPLLYVDKSCESGVFISIKQQVQDIIYKNRLSGALSDASVYARDFNEGDFMAINEVERYKAGSLMNVPLLITYLHQDEDNAGYLDKEILFEHATAGTNSHLARKLVSNRDHAICEPK